jgi:hypothetical protein
VQFIYCTLYTPTSSSSSSCFLSSNLYKLRELYPPSVLIQTVLKAFNSYFHDGFIRFSFHQGCVATSSRASSQQPRVSPKRSPLPTPRTLLQPSITPSPMSSATSGKSTNRIRRIGTSRSLRQTTPRATSPRQPQDMMHRSSTIVASTLNFQVVLHLFLRNRSGL